MMTRMFEYVGGGSDKFWEVTYPEPYEEHSSQWMCRWGRRGTSGQSKTFTERSPAKAASMAEEKIREKLAKGYVEVTRETSSYRATYPGPARSRSMRTQAPAPVRTHKPPPVSFERPKRKITLG